MGAIDDILTELIEKEAADDLYADAITFGQMTSQAGQTFHGQNTFYWTAWYAARKTADALLKEAKRVGVTDEQWEALRVVAAEVALTDESQGEDLQSTIPQRPR